MKISTIPLCLIFFVAAHVTDAGAATIFAESLGTVSTTTAIATHESNNGFDNDALTFSGTGDLRATTTSTGYTGASGSTNVFLTNNLSRTFQIDGISTLAYQAGTVSLSFGALKSTTASNMTTLVLEYSTDNVNWSPLAIPSQPTGTGTATWRLISLINTSMPISSTLSLRWTNTDATVQYRLDDITLTAVPEPASALLVSLGLLALVRRRR